MKRWGGGPGFPSRGPAVVTVGVALGIPFLIAIVLLAVVRLWVAAAAVVFLGTLLLGWSRLAIRRLVDEGARAGRALAETETALAGTRARLAEAERTAAVAFQVGPLAHEFKNLLTGIQGYARLLLDRVGPGDPIRRQLAAIEDAAARAAVLASRLQALGARGAAGTPADAAAAPPATSPAPAPDPAAPVAAAPPATSAAAPAVVAPGATRSPAAPDPGGRQRTILVVDDEPTILTLARDVLELEGHRILVARNGEEALRIYRDTPRGIDLVLLDLTMPVMGGLECFRRLRLLDPMVRVVISSGFTLEGAAADLMRDGALDCLQKPYEIQALARTVASALAQTPVPAQPAPTAASG